MGIVNWDLIKVSKNTKRRVIEVVGDKVVGLHYKNPEDIGSAEWFKAVQEFKEKAGIEIL